VQSIQECVYSFNNTELKMCYRPTYRWRNTWWSCSLATPLPQTHRGRGPAEPERRRSSVCCLQQNMPKLKVPLQ